MGESPFKDIDLNSENTFNHRRISDKLGAELGRPFSTESGVDIPQTILQLSALRNEFLSLGNGEAAHHLDLTIEALKKNS